MEVEIHHNCYNIETISQDLAVVQDSVDDLDGETDELQTDMNNAKPGLKIACRMSTIKHASSA